MFKLDVHISIFTGANWTSWWLAMSTFNQASGHTWVLLVQKPLVLGTTADMEEINFWIRWSMANNSIIDSIKIQLSEAIRAKFSTYEVAKDLIDALHKEYTSPGITRAYALFKELLKTLIPSLSYPTPGLLKIQTLFSHLKKAGYEVPVNIQGMLLLRKLPSSMDVIMQMIAQAKDMADKPVNPTVKGIYKAAVLSWDQCHMTDKVKQPAQANKISTVKPKEKEPTFQS